MGGNGFGFHIGCLILLLFKTDETAMIANRVTEKDLRDWLSIQGFCG